MKKPTPAPLDLATMPMPDVYPTSGGSFIMDPVTLELTPNPDDPRNARAPEPVQEADPAPAELSPAEPAPTAPDQPAPEPTLTQEAPQ